MIPTTTTERRRKPRPVISAADLLEGGWVAYQHLAGEPRPLPPADHPGWARLAREVRPEPVRRAVAPKVVSVAANDRRRARLRRRVVETLVVVVGVVMALMVGSGLVGGVL
jgi:hypothetical protein